jgi:ankyrin repeat protein
MPPQSVPTRALRERPDLDQLKRQAKELLAAFRAGDAAISAEVRSHYRGADAAAFELHDAQLVIARAYGFDSWPKLKAYVDGVTVTRLGEAVRAGDLATVRAMLNARPELVHTDMAEHNEHRALHYAVLDRNPDMVRLLMDRGADPFKGIWPHRDSTSALTIATERGYDDILGIIKDALRRRAAERSVRPADEAAPAIDRSSPIVARVWEAFQTGDEAAVLACLEAEPRLAHWHQGDGWTMLHQASLMLFLDVAKRLVAQGADVNACEPCSWTPLELVGVDRKTFTPEKAAAMRDFLIARGAKMTAGAAVAMGDTAWLKARHAEGTLSDPSDGYGLVSRAAMRRQPEVLHLLLDLGFDPDERRRLTDVEEIVYSWGEPLRAAARGGDLVTAEILLQRGADPNPSIYAASGPMDEAYGQNNREMIALLERFGGFADVGVIASSGSIDAAKKMLADEAAGRLRSRVVPDGSTVAAALLISGAAGGQVEIVRLALEHLDRPPGDPLWHGNLMQTLGAHAESDRPRYFECFRLILERAGANAPGAYGRSILHDVCGGWPRRTTTAEERLALATMLLDAGARLDGRDDLLKSTPLGWACRWGRVELVKLFLDRGADPEERDAEPWATPRAWAEGGRHADVLACLETVL